MKRFLYLWLAVMATTVFGAVPDYRAFRGSGGITIVSNPPNGTIVIDGSTISGSAAPGGTTFSVQYRGTNNFSGDTNFQYVPQHLVAGDPFPATLSLNFNAITNVLSGSGVGSASATEFNFLMGGLPLWGITTSGDLNTASDIAALSIGTIGLNRRPFYVNVQSSFNVNDRYALSASGTQWQVGNDGGWASGSLVANGAVRLAVASGGNIGIGTVTPTAHLTVTNDTITGAIAAFYASNNPAPALLINSNGFVGLGTAVPATALHILSPGAVDNGIIVERTGVSKMILGAGYFGNFFAGSSLGLYANNTLYWNIASAGHLLAQTDNTYGIGAAAASRPAYLHLGGGGAGTVGLTVGGGTAMIVTNGNVGIGTNAPAARLHVRPSTSGQSYFRVDDTNGTARLQVGIYPTLPNLAGLWLGDITPSGANVALTGDGTTTYLRGNTVNLQSTIGTAWVINPSGHFVAGTDNTYDIGASGATRPRDLYLGGSAYVAGLVSLASQALIYVPAAGVMRLSDNPGTSFNRLQFGGDTAAFPAIGRTNGHVAILGGNGTFTGANTNGLWVMGGPIIQDFTVTAPAAPSRQGAVYWNDGTNVCVVLRNSAGGLSTNKLSMTAWP